ncbi:MAG: hypothetical protein VYA80_06895 [Pseudomonadota bacterium]|nr:hypothetical protein [Pseudomonadota bacterium]
MLYSRIAIIITALNLFIISVGCSNITAIRSENQPSTYQIDTLVSGGPLHAIKGISFGPDGYLYVTSVYAESIYRVDVKTGEVKVAVGPPHGESDDVAFAPEGTMAWTALPSGELRAQDPEGEPYVIANKLPLINPVGYTQDGRLFVAQIGIDRFLEIDVNGNQPPKLVAEKIGHLNSFEISDNDQLYGPLAGAGTVARIDINTGEIYPIVKNLNTISAVNLNSQGQIFAVGWASGELLKIDPDTGEVRLIAELEAPLDNLAIDKNDMIYISLPARGTIVKVDPSNGNQTEVIPGNMSVPGGLSITVQDGLETLIIADDFGFRLVDTQSGRIWATTDLTEFMDPNAASDVAINDDVITFSDVSRSRVYMLDRASGKKIHKWRRFAKPYGVVMLESGDPIVAEFDTGKLIRLSRADRKLREIITDGLDGPVDLAWANKNSLYLTEALSGQLTQININDGNKTLIASGLNQPEGLTVLQNGDIAVVEVGAQQVSIVNAQNGSKRVIAKNLPLGGSFPKAEGIISIPTGIVAGKDGALYLTSDQDHSILKLTPKS